MRKLKPLKAVRHALNSVLNYRAVGIRFGLLWTAILLGVALIGMLAGKPPAEDAPPSFSATELLLSAIGLVSFCSIAVNWHRFVLRDEGPGKNNPMRLDEPVWRYLGNSLAVLAFAGVPLFILAVILGALPETANLLLIPAALLAGTFALALSLKLPAVALGRKDFGFGNSLAVCRDNFWQLMAVFLVNAAVVLAAVIILETIERFLGSFVGLAAGAAFNLFYTLFSVSVLTSLYGFFVEAREF